MTQSRCVHLIANPHSGNGNGNSMQEIASKICDQRGLDLINYEMTSPERLKELTKAAIDRATKDGGVVVAAGGDGTLRTVGHALRGSRLRFGVVACGTFNYFARAHNIPEDPKEAFEVAVTGKTQNVSVGEVNGETFLINASLGIYAKAFAEREKATARFGRNRFVAAMATLLYLLNSDYVLSANCEIDGEKKKLLTPMLFLGNNSLQLRNIGIDVTKSMRDRYLTLIVVKPFTIIEGARVVLKGILKSLEREDRLETFCVEDVSIQTRRSVLDVALDGELMGFQTPLDIKIVPDALNLVVPNA